MNLARLIEELERLQLKLQMESALNQGNESLAERLGNMAVEAADALCQAKSLASEAHQPEFTH